jgi:uncharacterized membrane protein YdjX (TVP38/TMEM64 family)
MESFFVTFQNLIINLFEANVYLAIIISILLNILISVTGVLPSIFITTINIHFFGGLFGLFISILGESIGAIASFYLYRKGIHHFKLNKRVNNKYFKRIKESEGLETLFFLFIFRILPFLPSGMVTLGAAFTRIDLISFTIVSTIGKIPSLLLEAMIAFQILNSTHSKLFLMFFSLFFLILYFLFKKVKKR